MFKSAVLMFAGALIAFGAVSVDRAFGTDSPVAFAEPAGGPGGMIGGTASTETNKNDLIYVVQKDARGETHLAVYRVSQQGMLPYSLRNVTWDLQVADADPLARNGKEWSVKKVKEAIEKPK